MRISNRSAFNMATSSLQRDIQPHDATADTALLARLRNGDAEALDMLVRIYAAPLIRHAARVIGSADRAQDIVQDVFLHLWQEREHITATRDIAAYLFWLTKNRARNNIQSDVAAHKREERWVSETTGNMLTVENSAEANLDAEEARSAVWAALSSVSPRNREIFMLVWDQQLPYSEVAQRFGISISSVRSQISRSLKRVIEVLGPRFNFR